MARRQIARDQVVKLIVGAGQASPSPPVGPALGSKGVKSIDFCKEFNARTAHMTPGVPIPARITVRPDRSFHFELRTPTTSYLLLQAAGVKERKNRVRGGGSAGKESIGEVSLKHVYDIAKIKHGELRLSGLSLEGLCKSVVAQARSCGLTVIRSIYGRRSKENPLSQVDANHYTQRQGSASATSMDDSQTQVRFASVNQEISPAQTLQSTITETSGQNRLKTQLSPEAQAELRSISLGLHGSQLQQRRMSNFAFEPVSLPVSRAPSVEPSPYSSRQPTRSNNASPLLSPRDANISQVSLSSVGDPGEDESRHTRNASGSDLAKVHPDSAQTAPRTSRRNEASIVAAFGEASGETNQPSSTPTTRPSSASDHASTRPTTLSQHSSMADVFSKQTPASREASPNRVPGSTSGTSTPPNAYSRPFTPRGNEDDPYARNKRRPQSRNLDSIDARFVFEGKEARRRSGLAPGPNSSSTGALPRSSSGNDIRNQEKRQSTFSLASVGGKKDGHGHRPDEGALQTGAKQHHGSMSDLKRFFGIGHHKNKRSQSPATSGKKSTFHTGTKTPPHRASSASVPFADDHGLVTKYGKFGKVLGSGAGGSVRLMKRSSDGVTFAVKQFRDRHSYETEREYSKKVTAEFCIGSTLHHGNIIETLDIIHERGHWYEVMEYAPYDLFAIVMTGKMSREEICCSFLQIVSGVAFLHSMGLAHRDLKLDNVVVNERGITKLIDFGSAAVFRYSGGRDGLICAWTSDADDRDEHVDTPAPSTLRNQIQAHTHWVNDILLAQSQAALVSASSDVSVKVWRPHAEERQIPTTIGLHSDYVKCLASPGSHSDWVASGGLDHKIRVWDLHGAGERLCINSGEDAANAKGSVYALSVRGSVMASGGPESTVRLWDARTGKRITRLVGHTDNIRNILINQDGDTVMTASSDQTVKVWSVTAGRCIHTLDMHNDSVWSLYSDHPQLAVIYSSDRSGLVVKTDLRASPDWDEGVSMSVAQEHDGVNKVIAPNSLVWTATSSSSINRWRDIPFDGEIQIPDQPQHHRWSASSRSKVLPPSPPPTAINGIVKPKIPLSCILRIPYTSDYPGRMHEDSEAATMYPSMSFRKMSEAINEQEFGPVLPFQDLPVATIQGQQGLIKHTMLNDKKRVLTLDTAGEVLMWDLLKCIPVQSFGKRHLDDVLAEVNTVESVANWCTVDTRTGKLACILEENYCFDAEMYADEVHLEEGNGLKEDQRINLGKWILRYLFARLIDEEIARDEDYRRQLQSKRSQKIQRAPAPHSMQMPSLNPTPWQKPQSEEDSLITPRASNGNPLPAATPGLAIGIATPHPGFATNGTSGSANEASSLEKTSSHRSQSRSSSEKPKDYFSANPIAHAGPDQSARPSTPGEDSSEASTLSPVDSDKADKEDKPKEGTSLFGKRFRMNFPKLSRVSIEAKPPAVDEKAEESDKSEEKEERIIEDNFLGTIQTLRSQYEQFLHSNPTQPLTSGVYPSSTNETPLLEPPSHTTIIIQEDRPDSGGVTDLYRGTVRSVGHDADSIERNGPMWLGDLLLRNHIPPKDISKVSFVLLPYQDQLPSIAGADGNSRLNANRMLRAKKICAYVTERIEPQPAHSDPNAMKPEEYLELYCQDKLVSPNTTLATLRAHIWKMGGDVVLYYKSNGRKPELEGRLSGKPLEEIPASEGHDLYAIISKDKEVNVLPDIVEVKAAARSFGSAECLWNMKYFKIPQSHISIIK
ncbi:MAG: hypothetical protein Q9216_003927 [Gyalolechia sp. 2 TL-2023]